MTTSSPGSTTERTARCSAWTPEAVTTTSEAGSRPDAVQPLVLASDRRAQRRQARVLRVEGVAVPQRLRRGLDDERGRREVRLAEVEAEHAVHRQRELPELADPRVRHARQRGRERRPVDGRAQRLLGHRSRSGSSWGTRTIVTAAGAGASQVIRPRAAGARSPRQVRVRRPPAFSRSTSRRCRPARARPRRRRPDRERPRAGRARTGRPGRRATARPATASPSRSGSAPRVRSGGRCPRRPRRGRASPTSTCR